MAPKMSNNALYASLRTLDFNINDALLSQHPAFTAVKTLLALISVEQLRNFATDILNSIKDVAFREEILEAMKTHISQHPLMAAGFVAVVVLGAAGIAVAGCVVAVELFTTAWLSSSGGSEAASVAFILLQNLGLQHGIIIKAQETVKDGMSLAGAAGKEIDQWAQGNYGEPVKDWWEGKHGNPVADWWGGKFGNPVSQWAEAVMQKGRQA